MNAWFYPYRTTLLREPLAASVTGTNTDGTVNMTVEDGQDTPEDHVPVVSEGGEAPADGRCCVMARGPIAAVAKEDGHGEA